MSSSPPEGMNMKITKTLGALLAASLLFTGCAAADEAADDDGVTTITVAANPSSQLAPLYVGIESGIFADHGLDVEIVHQTDVAAIVAGTASGQYDFGFATAVHVINSNLNDIALRAVTTLDGRQPTEEGAESGNSLVAGPDSGITSAADLEGKTLAVVGLASLNTFTAFNLAANAGVDPSSIELVQLPFGQMTAALSSGEVDAAVIQSPFISDAVAAGGTVIGKPNVAAFPDMAIGFFTTMQSYIDANEDVVEEFSDAVIESQEYASAHVDEARATLVDQLDLTEDAAAVAEWNFDGNPYMNVDGLEKAQELLIAYNGQEEELDVDSLVWSGSLETD